MGDPSLAVRDRRSRSMCCESALDAFTLADPCGGCGVPVSDRGREHGFGAPRLPALRFVRTARECPRPRLQRHAPRFDVIDYRGGLREVARTPIPASWCRRSTSRILRTSSSSPP